MVTFPASERAPKITLERATASKEDVATLIELETSLPHSATYIPTIDQAEAREDIESGVFYFVKQGEETIGSILYENLAPEHARISYVVTRPEFQGKGVARKAIQMVLEELKDTPFIDLVTHPDNERAIALYESLGFQRGEIKENYFGDGEPRLEMSLQK